MLETNRDITEWKHAQEVCAGSGRAAHVARVTTLGEMAASIERSRCSRSGCGHQRRRPRRFLTSATPKIAEAARRPQALIATAAASQATAQPYHAPRSAAEKERREINETISEARSSWPRERCWGTRARLLTDCWARSCCAPRSDFELEQVVPPCCSTAHAMRAATDCCANRPIRTEREEADRVGRRCGTGSGIELQLVPRRSMPSTGRSARDGDGPLHQLNDWSNGMAVRLRVAPD